MAAEIFGIVTGALATVGQSISLLQAVSKAANEKETLSTLISQHLPEVESTRSLIELVKAEDALKTPAVVDSLKVVNDAGCELNSQLGEARGDLDESAVKIFGRTLVLGPDGESKIMTKVENLVRAKGDLSHRILLCNVGLTFSVDKSMKVNTNLLEKIDRNIKERLGANNTLRIKSLIEGKTKNANGEVVLTTTEIDALTLDASEEDKSRPFKTVRNNTTKKAALMTNCPVSEVENWADANVTIEGNVGEESSTTFNYPIPAAVMAELLRIQKGTSSQPNNVPEAPSR